MWPLLNVNSKYYMITMNMEPLAILSLLKYFWPWQNCSIIGEQRKKINQKPKPNKNQANKTKQNTNSKHPRLSHIQLLQPSFFLVTSVLLGPLTCVDNKACDRTEFCLILGERGTGNFLPPCGRQANFLWNYAWTLVRYGQILEICSLYNRGKGALH